MTSPSDREFGELSERVRSLDSKFSRIMDELTNERRERREEFASTRKQNHDELQSLRDDVAELKQLADKGKGAWWATMLLASSAGATLAAAAKTILASIGGK